MLILIFVLYSLLDVRFNFILDFRIGCFWFGWNLSFSTSFWSDNICWVRTHIFILGVWRIKLNRRSSLWIIFLMWFCCNFLRWSWWTCNIFIWRTWRQSFRCSRSNFSCWCKCSIHVTPFRSFCWLWFFRYRFWISKLFLRRRRRIVIENTCWLDGYCQLSCLCVLWFLFFCCDRFDCIWRFVWLDCVGGFLFTHIQILYFSSKLWFSLWWNLNICYTIWCCFSIVKLMSIIPPGLCNNSTWNLISKSSRQRLNDTHALWIIRYASQSLHISRMRNMKSFLDLIKISRRCSFINNFHVFANFRFCFVVSVWVQSSNFFKRFSFCTDFGHT